MKFSIGCDPEIFLKDKSGELISSVGLIGGSKWKPQPISDKGHFILEDNVAVEFNIPPSNNCHAFISHINFTMDYLLSKTTSMGLEFSTLASASFPEEQLNTPDAQNFGCEPDYNAWTNKINKRPYIEDQTLRSCGGHIHVGTSFDAISVIRSMDLHLGIPSLYLDSDVQRRKLYGKAGAFRYKPYGCEYRTLSNFWIWDDKLKEWAYEQTEKALEFVEEGNEINKYQGMQIQKAINTNNHPIANNVNKYFGL